MSFWDADAAGGDPHFANVDLLLHFDTPIAVLPPVCLDSSINAHIPGTVGSGLTLSTTTVKFGASSVRALGSPANTRIGYAGGILTPGLQDFCYECWYYTAHTGRFDYFFNMSNTGTNGFYFSKLSGPDVLYVQKPGADLQGTTAIPLNQWNHVAFARVSGVSRLFLNGAIEAFGADTTNYSSATNEVLGGSGVSLDYYIDDYRVTIGSGRYSAPFTPPPAPFPDF